MPDLPLSNKHPLHPARVFTLQPKFTMEPLRRRGNLFKFAHLSGHASSTLGAHEVELNTVNRVGNLAAEAITARVSSRQMLQHQCEE
jgi:hypothetical protein